MFVFSLVGLVGPERFFVYEKVYDEFCDGVVKIVKQMKTSRSSLHDNMVDCGAICMGPRQMALYQRLVDDCVSKGGYLLYVNCCCVVNVHVYLCIVL